MRGKWLLFSGIVIFLAIGAGALSVLRKPAQPVVQKAEAPTLPSLGDEITVIGKIEAAHVVAVPAPVEGDMEAWDVEVGQEVLEDQLLGRIRNSNLEAERENAQTELDRAQTKVTNIEGLILAAKLEAARAEADSARADIESIRLQKAYIRQQALLKEGATPRLVFEKAEKEYKAAQQEASTAKSLAVTTADRVGKLEKDLAAAKTVVDERTADLEEAKENLDAANVLAPVDGMVIKLGVEVGGAVERAMQDLVVIAIDPAILDVVIEVDPRAVDRIKPGAPALVLVPDVTSEALSGEVKEVKENKVTVEFTSPNPAIKHGMTASVRLKLP